MVPFLEKLLLSILPIFWALLWTANKLNKKHNKEKPSWFFQLIFSAWTWITGKFISPYLLIIGCIFGFADLYYFHYFLPYSVFFLVLPWFFVAYKIWFLAWHDDAQKAYLLVFMLGFFAIFVLWWKECVNLPASAFLHPSLTVGFQIFWRVILFFFLCVVVNSVKNQILVKDKNLTSWVNQGGEFFLLVVFVILSASFFDGGKVWRPITPIIAAVLGAFSAGLGFGLKDTFSNYIAGVTLKRGQSVKNGDRIRVGDFTGKVISITAYFIKVRSDDGNVIYIPASRMISELVTVIKKNNSFEGGQLGLEIGPD